MTDVLLHHEPSGLRASILRTSRAELACEFYNALLGGHTTVLGTRLEEAKAQTWGIVIEAPETDSSRWFPHMVGSEQKILSAQLHDRGGSYHRETSPFEHLVMIAPDKSQMIITEETSTSARFMPYEHWRPLRVMLELCTREIDASAEFYAHILGLTQIPVPDDPHGYRVFFAGDTSVAGAVDMTTFFLERTQAHWIPYFHVDNVDDSLYAATTYGARVTVPADNSMFGARYAVLTDPTGATFGLRSNPSGGMFGYFSAAMRRFLTRQEITEYRGNR